MVLELLSHNAKVCPSCTAEVAEHRNLNSKHQDSSPRVCTKTILNTSVRDIHTILNMAKGLKLCHVAHLHVNCQVSDNRLESTRKLEIQANQSNAYAKSDRGWCRRAIER